MNLWTFGTPALLATTARLFACFLLSGQRRNEIANLQWHEIDFEREEITLPPERTKNSLVHVLPMSPQILAILQQTDAIAGRDFLFGEGPNAGFQAWSRSKRILDEKINAARAARGEKPIAPWQLHDLRRSFVTHLVEQKLAPPHIVEACVNHQSGHRGGVAGVYNRALYTEEKKQRLRRGDTSSQLDAGLTHELRRSNLNKRGGYRTNRNDCANLKRSFATMARASFGSSSIINLGGREA